MGFRDIFYSEDEKRRLDLRAKIKEREQAAKPSGRRPRVSPNFSGGKRRSRKLDQFGFDESGK
jgi:hypothetical protein